MLAHTSVPLLLLSLLWRYPSLVSSAGGGNNEDRPDPPAKCTDATAQWTFNDLGRSPCNISRALVDACFGPAFVWPIPIDPNAEDGPPEYDGVEDDSLSNKCECSSVTYVMLSACSFCQGGSIDTWEDYIRNCHATDISVGSFPLTFPPGITIPSWSFVDVTVDNLWIPSEAENLAGTSPDLSENPPQTASVRPTSTGPLSSPALSTSTAAPTPTSTSHKKSRTGAIVGGVIGALAGVGLIAVGVAFFLRRRRGRPMTKAQFFSRGITDEKSDSSVHIGSSSKRYGVPRLYDPADPSTYPSPPPGRGQAALDMA